MGLQILYQGALHSLPWPGPELEDMSERSSTTEMIRQVGMGSAAFGAVKDLCSLSTGDSVLSSACGEGCWAEQDLVLGNCYLWTLKGSNPNFVSRLFFSFSFSSFSAWLSCIEPTD